MLESCLSCDLMCSLMAAGFLAISIAWRISSGLWRIWFSSGLRYRERERERERDEVVWSWCCVSYLHELLDLGVGGEKAL